MGRDRGDSGDHTYYKNKRDRNPRGIETIFRMYRCKVECVFYVIKDIFGVRTTRYRGLTKLKTRQDVLRASANLFVLAMAMRVEKLADSQFALPFEA